MPLKKFRFINLGPFDEIEFEFDEHVNVFTGPNNSGKSTALMALGEIAVYPFGLPRKLLRDEPPKFEVQLALADTVFQGQLPINLGDEEQRDRVVSFMTAIGYSYFVPAIRHSTDFRAEAPIISKKQRADPDLESRAVAELRRRWIADNTPTGDSSYQNKELDKRKRLFQTDASLISDETVVQKIIELDYRAYRKENPAIRNIIDRTVAIASEITEGYPISFERVDEDENGLFPQFRTPDGAMPLNVLSQGTQSLIQWLARLLIGLAEYYDYPEDIEGSRGTLVIDEIDAHLHPSWQRRIIPVLTKHFPNLQIFCSTHSPLMLAGLKTGQVQLLQRDHNGKVTVTRNEQDIVGWSADQILRDFLDVQSPTDLETQNNIERLRELRQLDKLTDEQSEDLDRLGKTVRRRLIGGPLAAELQELRSILHKAKIGHD